MRKLPLCLAFAALSLLCGPASTQAEVEPVAVWILPFDVLGDSSDERVPVADLLTASLSRFPEYAVVDRQALAEVLAELSGTRGDRGQLVCARWMLHGTVTRRGDSLGITAHVTDVTSTRILGSVQVSGETEALPRLVEALTSELREIPRSADPLAGPTDPAPVANLHFMRGLSHYHQGRYHRALAEFIRSGADPEIEELSALWRANSYLAAERYDHAFLEVSRLRRQASERVKPEDLQRLLDECLQHLSAEEVQAYREL